MLAGIPALFMWASSLATEGAGMGLRGLCNCVGLFSSSKKRGLFEAAHHRSARSRTSSPSSLRPSRVRLQRSKSHKATTLNPVTRRLSLAKRREPRRRRRGASTVHLDTPSPEAEHLGGEGALAWSGVPHSHPLRP
jgi:hypothetical protein